MGAFIRILNTGSSWTGFVHITAVRTVIFEGKAIELIHKTDFLRHPVLPQPSFAFYIFLGLFGFGGGIHALTHPPRSF